MAGLPRRAALNIGKPVGRGAINQATDVSLVQLLLTLASRGTGEELAVDGHAGQRTISAIEDFQRRVLHRTDPDGCVDPDGATMRALLAAADAAITQRTTLPIGGGVRMVEADYERAARTLECEVAAIKAVALVESAGDGFLPSGRPKILFEAHVFSRFTQHRYDRAFPDISSAAWNRGLYAGGEKEYDRLLKSMLVDRASALSSTSWGRFQIMGFNHQAAGVATLEAFITAMFSSEGAHLDAVVAFLQSTRLDTALRSKDWAQFAAGYNGPGYSEQRYDLRLKTGYEELRRASTA